jgi:signal transduction histidine kinase
LSFAAPERVRFKYRLNGFENEWIYAETKRSAHYSYIPPGTYAFQVIACNNDGIWNETGAQFAFRVLPHFWQTLWFRLLGGGTMAIASGGVVWLDARRRMRRKLERLERQRAIEQERARIAHDIHDDLGVHLTRISMLSDPVRAELDGAESATGNLKRIHQKARELTRAMDEIVWAVNPQHDTFESLVSYLHKFAEDFLESTGIPCRLAVPFQLPSWSLSAEVRHNVFLAFKEALNNIARHAAASEVHFSLTLEPAAFSLAIEDNGRGFVTGATATANAGREPAGVVAGNGLRNMRLRLENIGGRCDVRSAPGQGTTVTFYLPVDVAPA